MRLKLKVNWRRNYSLIRDQGNVNKPLDFQNEKIIIENYEYGKKLSQKRNLWSQQQILNVLWHNTFFTIFPSCQNFLPSHKRVKMFKSYYEEMWILKDRWDLPHASCFKQAVGMKGSWSLGYNFGTNSCCTLFNLCNVCFDAEEKLPTCRYYYEYDYEIVS